MPVKNLPVKKENSTLLDGGSTAKGNGADRHIPVGLAGGSDLYRGFLKFSLNWSGVYQIKKAVLVVKSTDEVHLSFGAGPTLEVQRVSEYWAEAGGSEGNWIVSGKNNAIHPGPSVTGSTYTGGPWGTGTGTYRRIDITTLVDAWAPSTVLTSTGAAGSGNDNHGLRLKSPDEGTTADRYEVYGSRAAQAGKRPYIELTYSDNHPPNAPTVTSPESDDPAIVASSRADRLPIDFLFSDPDATDTCTAVAVEVYGDGATDGSPGTRIARLTATPTALGPLNSYRATLTTTNEDSGQTLSPRTNMRYRVATRDNERAWSPWTSLADGRFYLAYTVAAPSQLYMDPLTDDPHIYGSLATNDTSDYITGAEVEVYRDTAAGSTTLWAPGTQGIGGSSTRVDMTYAGESLKNLETVRWRLRLVNRDGVAGEWSPWQYTKVYSTTGPDAMSPIDTSTKLTSRTADLTIAHSAAFDGYRWRLYRNGSVIYDSGETAMTSGTSATVNPPADLLSWGDGSDEDVPLEWEAQIRVTAVGAYGDWSPRYAIRVNALPGASISLASELSAYDYVDDSTPTFSTPYENPDQEAYNEWPRARVLEVRESTTTGGAYPAHDGTLLRSQAQRHADTAITTEVTLDTAMTADTEYEVRARFADDADAIASTTLAANSSAAATNIKVTSVTGLAVGQVLEIDTGADYEVRTITAVGTAGSGGTGVDLDDALEFAHTSGDAVEARYWGGWSNTELVTYHAAPTASPSAPADTATVNDPLQQLSWTLSTTQAAAIVRIYERDSGVDYLVYEDTITGTTTSWSAPAGLLDDGVTYAWDVQAFDAYGLSDTTTRRTFTTSFTAPAELADLAATTDEGASAVDLTWTASADTYFDHYEVSWLDDSGAWQRVDAGPRTLDDGRTKLTTAAFTHYGARFGDNDYKVTASNGSQVSDPAYITVELEAAVDGYWMLVIPDETQYTRPIRVIDFSRRHEPMVERFDPPGRGSSITLTWGRGPLVVDLRIKHRPIDEGGLSSVFEAIEAGGLDVYIKAPPGWQWDPVHAHLRSYDESPERGGMLTTAASFAQSDDDD